MNCPKCKAKVKDNSQYSIHMNIKHRGSTYKPLYETKGKSKNGTSVSKENVDSILEE